MYKIKEMILKIKYAYQRVVYGFDKRAYGDIPDYFTPILQKVIFEMSNNLYSCPIGLEKDEWEKILNKIAFGFGSYIEMETGIYNDDEKEYKRLNKEFKKGLKLFAKYYKDLWN